MYQGTVDEELKFITYVDQATEDLKEIRIADSVKKSHIPAGGKVKKFFNQRGGQVKVQH